jgi:hypothetical protein
MLYTDNVYGPRSTASGALETFYISPKEVRLSGTLNQLYFDYTMNDHHDSRSIRSHTITQNDDGSVDICEVSWQQ